MARQRKPKSEPRMEFKDGQLKQAKTKVSTDFNQERSRKFCIITYIDRNALERFLKNAEWVQHWAFCSHDRDVKEDGFDKESHSHVLLYTYNAKTSSAVKKIFDRYSAELYKNTDTEAQNSLVQYCYDMPSQWRYLIHKDDPNKAQYEECERICDNYSYWHNLDKSHGMNESDENTGLAMFEDILAGVSIKDMIRRYGKEFIYHYSQLIAVVASHNREEFLSLRNDKGEFKIFEMFPALLEGSQFTQETKNAFFMVLNYIRNECLTTFNSQLNFYLDERK